MSPRGSFHRLALALALGPFTALTQPAAEAPRSFTAGFDSLSLDLRSNKSIYTNVRITDGSVTITAAEGSTDETSFEDSQWQFAGGVSITVASAVLRAESATFLFRNGALLHGELDGGPVEISDFVAEQQLTVRGTADHILFDNTTQTAALNGRATLALGANEYSGCDLVYHLSEKTFNSGSSECGVQFTIFPDQAAGATDSPTGQ
jgi:lipopolysaccharide export system protein LptA